MGYTSNRPTKEKKQLYEFMEKHKKQGVVGLKDLKEYGQKKKFSNKREFDKLGDSYYSIWNEQGSRIATVGLHKKTRRINYWNIL